MTRSLTFAPDRFQMFALLYIGFVSGGNALHVGPQGNPVARTRDERAKEAAILRGLKAISVEVDGSTPPKIVAEGEGVARKLRDDGGTLTLDQKQHELLVRYLDAAPFQTQDSDRVDFLLDWVAAADKTEGDKG